MSHKGKRRVLTLEQKRDIIRRRDEGQGGRAIGRILGLNESTVRNIYAKRDEILKSCKAYGSSVFDSRSKVNSALVKIERYLALWKQKRE